MGFFSRKRDILAVLSRMEWGAATPEFSNEQIGDLVHVFNHDLQTASNVERALRFAAGRIKWYTVYLRNAFPHHRIIFDDEGQTVGANTREYIRQKLKPYADTIIFTSEGEAYGL